MTLSRTLPLGPALAALALSVAPAAAQSGPPSSVWRYDPGPRGGIAESCSRVRGETVCAAVACTRRGTLVVGLTGWDPRRGGDRLPGRIGVDGRGAEVDFVRAGPEGRFWRAETGRRTDRLIRRMKEGYTLEIGLGPRGRGADFTLDNSHRAITRLERACAETGRSARGAGDPAEVIGSVAGAFLGEILDDDRYRAWDDDWRADRRHDAGRNRGDRLAPAPGPRWLELGAARVDRARDRDIFKIGRAAGRLDALRLGVDRTGVRLRSALIVYGNGQEERIEFGRRIAPGTLTRPLRLRGQRGRYVRKVSLLYETEGRGPRAGVTLWGRGAS